jgi:hypothetical protein
MWPGCSAREPHWCRPLKSQKQNRSTAFGLQLQLKPESKNDSGAGDRPDEGSRESFNIVSHCHQIADL